MTRETYLAFCASLEGAKVDQPFQMDFETSVARHEKNRKWFAILMRKGGSDFVNLKCEPLKGGLLRGMFKGVRPGWHMNKDHWISVDFMGDVPEEILCRLTRDSHALTAPRMRKGRKLSGEPAEGVGIVHPDRHKP